MSTMVMYRFIHILSQSRQFSVYAVFLNEWQFSGVAWLELHLRLGNMISSYEKIFEPNIYLCVKTTKCFKMYK